MAGEEGDDKKDLGGLHDGCGDDGAGNASDDEVYAAICDDGHEYTSKVRSDNESENLFMEEQGLFTALQSKKPPHLGARARTRHGNFPL